MKNTNIFFITIAILSLGFLAGCETVPTVKNEPTPETEKMTAVPSSSIDKSDTPANQIDLGQTNGEDPDQTSYATAVTLSDASFCAKILEKDKAANCEQAVSDQQKFNEAIYANDKALCDGIVDNDMKQSCQIKVEGNQAFEQQQAQAELELKGQYETYSQLINSGKTEDCAKSLQDSAFVANCEATIITNTAIMNQDASECAAIKSTADQEECKKVVESL